MAHGSQILFFLAAALSAADYRFPMRHEHLRKGCDGEMIVRADGISFNGPKHARSWKYEDIQQLKLGPRGIHLVTYKDNALLLGADREYDFRGAVPKGVYAFWKDQLDQRFVAELSEEVKPLWSIPVKHVRRIKGTEGKLEFARDRIVYVTDDAADSRTWRLSDIENVSTSGPFQLTIVSFEKSFQFQLKQALDEGKYNQLWRQINLKTGRMQ